MPAAVGVSHCTAVEEVLQAVANMADAHVLQTFRAISMLPQISSLVLGKMSEDFTDLFMDSRDLSCDEEERPRRRSSRLKPKPPCIGTRRSGRKAVAIIKDRVAKDKKTKSDSDFIAEDEDDSNDSTENSKSDGSSEQDLQREPLPKEVTTLKRTTSSRVSSIFRFQFHGNHCLALTLSR
jgi:hypothetical protein